MDARDTVFRAAFRRFLHAGAGDADEKADGNACNADTDAQTDANPGYDGANDGFGFFGESHGRNRRFCRDPNCRDADLDRRNADTDINRRNVSDACR